METLELPAVEEMNNDEILREILLRLRQYEVTVRGVIEAAKQNPMLAQMLRASGVQI